MRSDGTGVVRLTNTPDINENNPSWSPDAKRLAFTRDVRDAERGDGIAVMAVRAGARATVIKQNVYQEEESDTYSDPKWSPNGDWLAVTHVNIGYSSCSPVWVERITPTGTTLPGSFRAFDPDVDPGGTWVAGSAENCDFAPWILKRNMTTGKTAHVTRMWDDPAETDPVWSPSGRQIAFQNSDYLIGGWTELGVINADRTGKTIIVPRTPGVSITPRDWRAG